MGKFSGHRTTVKIGGVDISKSVENVKVGIKRDLHDASGFGEPKNFVDGQYDFSVELDIWFDDTATTGAYDVVKTAMASLTGTALFVQANDTGDWFGSGTLWTMEGYELQLNKGEAAKLGTIVCRPVAVGTVSNPLQS